MTAEYGNTPVGRFVMGSLTEKNTTDHQNRPLDSNRHHFFLGVAIRKDDPDVGPMLGLIYNKAMADFQRHPNVVAKIQQGLGGPFHWKIDDGDLPKYADKKDEKGVPTCAGCWIMKFSTTLPIQTGMWNGSQTVQCDPAQIERGSYVDVAFGVRGNDQVDETCGIYLNPQSVRFCAYGAKIPTGPSLEEQFGAAPRIPAGASAAPTAPAAPHPATGMPAGGAGMPGAPAAPAGMPTAPAGMPAPGGANGMGVAPPAAPTASPSSAHPPHPGILGGGGMPGA